MVANSSAFPHGCEPLPQPDLRRQRLRAATGSAHREVEQAIAAVDYFGSVADYGRYLAIAARLYGWLEGALDGAGARQLLADWHRRRKATLVLADLRVLGFANKERVATAPGPCMGRHGWQPHHAGDILGALYVMEGATLGGAVLARRMEHLGITRERGGGLLDPYGPERGAMWRTFLDQLEAVRLSDKEEAALCPSASAVFVLFKQAFAPCQRH